jgi:hypothetical protein
MNLLHVPLFRHCPTDLAQGRLIQIYPTIPVRPLELRKPAFLCFCRPFLFSPFPCGGRFSSSLHPPPPSFWQDLAADPLKPVELLPYRPVEWRFTHPRGDACGLCPETVFTPDQMREADWRSSTAGISL